MAIFSNKVFFDTISQLEENLNTIDLSFLFRKSGEINNLKFITSSRITDMIKNFWEIDMKGHLMTPELIKTVINAFADELGAGTIKAGNFVFVIENEKLYLKNGDLILAEFTEDKVTFFVEISTNDLDSAELKSSDFIIDDLVQSDKDVTTFETTPVFRKNFNNQLITKKEFEARDNEIRDYIAAFDVTSKKVDAIINSDRTPTFKFGDIELSQSTKINLSTSAIVIKKENLPKLYLAESRFLDSNYISNSDIYNTFNNGFIQYTFTEEFTCFKVNNDYFVIQFLDYLNRSIELKIKEDHGKIKNTEDIKVFKFDSNLNFVEEVTGDFQYGDLMLVNSTKNYLKSTVGIKYDIHNVFNENYTGEIEMIVNEGLNFSLEPRVIYSNNNVTDQDRVNFYQREFTNYSGEVGYGYYTEEEISKNRKFDKFDFSNGMIEEETGNRISISDINFSLYIPSKIGFAGEKENFFKIGGVEYNLSEDFDLRVELSINKGIIENIYYEDKNEALGDSSDQTAWDNAVKNLLINSKMIDENNKLINIYFNYLQLHKILVEKTIELDFEVITEVKNFRFKDSLTLVPRELLGGDLLLNNSSTGEYVFTLDRTGDDFGNEVMSEKVKFSYSNFTELINNIEVEKVTFEIYDNLNYNPVTDENKSTQSPTKFVFEKIDGIFYPERDYGNFVDVDNLSVYTQFSSQNIDSYIYLKMIIDRKFENKQVVFDKKYKISDLDLTLKYTLNSIEQQPGENEMIKADIENIEKNGNIHDINIRVVCEDFRGIDSLKIDMDFTNSNNFIAGDFPYGLTDFNSYLSFIPVKKISLNQSITTSIRKTLKIKWKTDIDYHSVILANNFSNKKWSISNENTLNKKANGYEIYWTVDSGENLANREFKFLVDGRRFVCPEPHELEITFSGASIQFDYSSSLDNLYCWNITEDNIPDTVNAMSLFNLENYLFNDRVILLKLNYLIEKSLGNNIDMKIKSENRVDFSEFTYLSGIEYKSDVSGIFDLLDSKNNAKNFSYSNALASPNFIIFSRIAQGSTLVDEFSDSPRVRFYMDRPEILSELRIFKLNISEAGEVSLGEELQTAFNPNGSFYFIVSQEEEANMDFLNNRSYAIIAYSQSSKDYSDIKCTVKMYYDDLEIQELGNFTIFNYSLKSRYERTFVSEFTGHVIDDEINFRLGMRLGGKILSSVSIVGDILFREKNMLSNVRFDKHTLVSGGTGDGIVYSEDNLVSDTFNFMIDETLTPGTPPLKREVDLMDSRIYDVKYINETEFVSEDLKYLDLRCYDNTGDFKFKVRQIDESLPNMDYISITDHDFSSLRDVGTFFSVREADVNEGFYKALLSKFYQESENFKNFYSLYAFEDLKGLNFSTIEDKTYYFTGSSPYKYYESVQFKPIKIEAGVPTELEKFQVDLPEDFLDPIVLGVEFENPINLNNIRKYSSDTKLKTYLSMSPATSRSSKNHLMSINNLLEVPNYPNIIFEPFNLKAIFNYLTSSLEIFNGIQYLDTALKIISEDVEIELTSSDTYINFPKIRIDIDSSIFYETSAVLKLLDPMVGEIKDYGDGETIEILNVYVDLLNEDRKIMGTVYQDQLELTGLNPITPYNIRMSHRITDDVYIISDDVSFITDIPDVYVRELVKKRYGSVEFMAEGADNFLSRCYSFNLLKPSDIKGESPIDEGDFYNTETPIIGDTSTEEQNKKVIIRVLANKHGKSSSNINPDTNGDLDYSMAPYFYTQPKDMPEVTKTSVEKTGNDVKLHFQEIDYPTDVKIKCMIIDEDGVINYLYI